MCSSYSRSGLCFLPTCWGTPLVHLLSREGPPPPPPAQLTPSLFCFRFLRASFGVTGPGTEAGPAAGRTAGHRRRLPCAGLARPGQSCWPCAPSQQHVWTNQGRTGAAWGPTGFICCWSLPCCSPGTVTDGQVLRNAAAGFNPSLTHLPSIAASAT